MSISKNEAEGLLAEVTNTMERTRKSLTAGCTSNILILWGVIWFLAFLGTQFLPQYTGRIWLILDTIGFVITSILGFSGRRPVKTSFNWNIFFFWLLLFIFGDIWLVLLWPWNRHQIAAFGCTLVMFAYVVMGLFFWGRFFIWLGLSVTALTLVGYFLLLFNVVSLFGIWMALAGGGALAGAGVYLKVRARAR